MKFEKLEQAVEYAVKNKYGFFVQRYFVPEEHLCEVEPKKYDPEVVLNCDFDFFTSKDEAENFRRTNMWDMIVGNHQWTIDVQAYLDYYGQQVPVKPEIEQMIILKNQLARQTEDTIGFDEMNDVINSLVMAEQQKKLIKKTNLFPDIDEDNLPF